mmetsp:Transcript_96/g.217  ORF Transcript_96/g.217 Transcript_96/m.217 type:complete len:83 (+) Transcript_96:1241-1489(+)
MLGARQHTTHSLHASHSYMNSKAHEELASACTSCRDTGHTYAKHLWSRLQHAPHAIEQQSTSRTGFSITLGTNHTCHTKYSL